MKFHPGILIAVAIKLGVLALGVCLYLYSPEKSSIVRVDGDRHNDRVSLTIVSLDGDKPFDWTTSAGGSGRGSDNVKINPYDANRFRISCRDHGFEVVHERELPAAPSRFVTITVYGCRAIEVRSSPLPKF